MRSPVVTPQRQDWRKLVPGLIISAIAILAILYFVDLKRLFTALQQADYRYIAVFFAISLSWLAVRGLVWRTLLQEKASYSQVFLTLNEGYLLNNVLPFRLGELARAFLLSKKANLGFWEVFSTILIERALDVAFAAGLLFATLPFVMKVDFAWQAGVTMGSLVLAGLGCLYLLARNQSWALRQYDRLTDRFPKLKRLVGQQQLNAFFAGLGSPDRRQTLFEGHPANAVELGHCPAAILCPAARLFAGRPAIVGGFYYGSDGIGGRSPVIAGSSGRAGSLR